MKSLLILRQKAGIVFPMSESAEWEQIKYAEVLEEELRGLERRIQNDSSCTLESVQGILSNLYIHEGNNWEGRGRLQDVVLSATIAAYEQFIAEWKQS